MSKILTVIISLIAGVVLTAFVGLKMFPDMMLIEVVSPYGFEDTLEKLKKKAKDLGWKVPKKWPKNFQKNLKRTTKIDVGPVTVLKMCEVDAAAGILIHDELKILSVFMPCSIAVYEKSDGKVYIGIMNMDMLGLVFGEKVDGWAKKLAPQMMEIITLE